MPFIQIPREKKIKKIKKRSREKRGLAAIWYVREKKLKE